MNEIRSEVRGIRLMLGALVTFLCVYWLFTGQVFRPLAYTLTGSDPYAVKGFFADIADILTGIFYIVGTVTGWILTNGFKFVGGGVSELSERLRGGRKLASESIDSPSVLPEDQNMALHRDASERLDSLEAWRSEWESEE